MDIVWTIVYVAFAIGAFYFVSNAIVNIIKARRIRRKIRKSERMGKSLNKSLDEAEEKYRTMIKANLHMYGVHPSEQEFDEIMSTIDTLEDDKDRILQYIQSLTPDEIPTAADFVERVNKNITTIMSEISTEPRFLDIVKVHPDDFTDEDIRQWYFLDMEASAGEGARENLRWNYNLCAVGLIMFKFDELSNINESAALEVKQKINGMLNGTFVLSEYRYFE